VCSLPAYARVAEFLRYWAESTARRGLRSDRITLHISRAEIGNYLGITLETVSRALSSLVRGDLIEFAGGDHRDIRILDVAALAEFAQGCRELAPAVLQ
jgi:CRP/FNR family transcriptional regulator